MPAADDEDDFRDVRHGRLLRLSVTHVEVRLYRSSRTASDSVPSQPHFEYFVQCEWVASTQQAPDGGEAAEELHWWDTLPSRYVVRRRWAEIVKFHETIDRDLVFDRLNNCRRIKSRMPRLPDKGDLDAFILGVAETGDAGVLRRKKPLAQSDNLSDIHTIYVENRLRPYFAEVCKVLDELPAEVLAESKTVRRFVFDGTSCKKKPGHPATRNRYLGGTAAVSIPSEDKHFLAKRLQKQWNNSALAETELSFGGTLTGGMSREVGGHGGATPQSPQSPSAKSAAGVLPPARSAAASMAKSASAPALDAGEDDDSACDDTLKMSSSTDRQKRRQRLHYGFFAQNLKGPEVGFTAKRDLWRLMQVKERRELGRRTRLANLSGEERPNTKAVERLPRLPPPGPHDTLRASQENYVPKGGPRHDKRQRSPSVREPPKQLAGSTTNTRSEIIARDICEGLRVVLLGAAPPTESRRARMFEAVNLHYPYPTLEETLQIYKTYRTLLTTEEDQGGGEQSGEDDDAPEAVLPMKSPLGFGAAVDEDSFESECNLMPISWPHFFLWSQRELDLAGDYRLQSVCAALNRSLRLWWQSEASKEDRYLGVSISLLFQWIWPTIGPDWIATMLTWICNHEIEKIRKPTPDVIQPQERQQLESIFKAMDSEGLGYCTAEDIAGGKIQDVETKLKNIVDVDTVRSVVSDARIYPISFLELMCEDGKRAHEGATRVSLPDGKTLVLQTREAVGFSGWVYCDADVPPWEQAQRRLIDAIEAEVRRFRRMASSKPPPLWYSVGGGDTIGASTLGSSGPPGTWGDATLCSTVGSSA